MNSLDLLKRRLNSLGGNSEGRLIKQKLNTLKQALNNSYQAEVVSKDGEEYKALINNNKLKMDYDDKIISVPFESGFKVGDLFYWEKTQEWWIIYLKHYSEDAYFRGYIRKAHHLIKWENEYGKVCETYGAVRGPVETKVKSEMKSGLAFDKPNYTLSFLIPDNSDTAKLKRYSKFALEGKMWEIVAEDNISEPGIIELHAVEYYTHEQDDKKVLCDKQQEECKECTIIETETSLDKVKILEIDEPFALWAKASIDGVEKEELSKDARFTVVKGSAVITNGFLHVLQPPGELIISLDIPKGGYSRTFVIETLAESLPPAMDYVINGNTRVKSFGTATYTISHFVDGIETNAVDGSWVFVDNKKLFKVLSNTKESITFDWNVGYSGSLELSYVVNGSIVDTIKIKIDSLI